MKKKNNSILIIIAIVVVLLIGIGAIVLFSGKKDEKYPPSDNENHYNITSTVEEPEGTQTYTSDTLKAEHCLDSICVEEVSFYYTDEGGRVEYTVINKSEMPASGFLKLVFDSQSLYITYQDLPAGGKKKTATFYSDIQIKNMEDYHIERLTEEENKKIVYSK